MKRRPGWIVALAALAPAALAPASLWAQDVVINDVNVVDVRNGALLRDRTVVVEGGHIVSVTEVDAPAAAEGAVRIDGTGRYLIPGLWDMHAHMRHTAAPALVMPQYFANGVTGIREMASACRDPGDIEDDEVCLSDMLEWRAHIESGELLGPRILAVSSFPLNPGWGAEISREEADGLIGSLADRGADVVKVYYRLPPEVLGYVIDAARARGLDVSGHLPLRLTSAQASEAGIRSVEHARDFLFDCFPGSAEFRATARNQNPPMEVMRAMVEEHDVAQCDEAFATFVRNDTWYVPTHVTRRMDAYADDPEFRDDPRRKHIPDVVWDEWQDDADGMVALDPSPEGRRVMRSFYEKGLEITGRAHDAGVGIVLGTDGGDTYVFFGSGVHDELGELVKAGLTPAEALAAATIRSAEFLRRSDEFGTIEPGRRADMVLLRANPLEDIANSRSIEAVVFDGRVHSRAQLDDMMDTVDAGIEEMNARGD